MEALKKYFPNLTESQYQQFGQLKEMYTLWNSKINVVSRKDIDQLNTHHVLHSLAITKVIRFNPGSSILDVGTGGGFPGVPLAIFHPEVEFMLIDSIGKKIKVVNEVCGALGIKNVTARQVRSNELKGHFDFIVSRAVTAFPKFLGDTQHLVSNRNNHNINNGILYLKGGDFEEEVKDFRRDMQIYPITDWFSEEFFETKKVIYWQKR